MPGTLPTGKTRSEFRYHDLTAVEIAHELGYSELWDILTPVIHHFLPAKVLIELEIQFHQLIHAELADPSISKNLRLPQLVVLTELENPEMWFPVYPQSEHGKVRSMQVVSCGTSLMERSRDSCFALTGANLWF